MSNIVNPYVAGSPITGSKMFFGREDIFDFICRTLTGLHRDNVIVLYGQRRTGKTSVLYQIHSHLDERYLCIFVDLHGFALAGLGGFLWELANHILRVLRRDYQIDLLRPDRTEFMADPRSFFENEFLPQVWLAIGNRQVLLMIDEAIRLQEQVQAGKLEHEIFEYMRHLMQHHEQLSFLFSLGSGLEEMEQEYAFLFSVGLYKKISFLDPDAVHALITQPVRDYYQVEPATENRIMQITSGHPYYTQLLCHSLFNRWQQRHVQQVTIQDVDEVLDEVVERGLANLKYVWEESTPGEKAVLAGITAAMGDSNRPVGIDEINQAWARCDVVIPKSEITEAIKRLIAREVIKGKEKYVFTVDLQRIWIQKYRRLEWVEEEVRHTLPLGSIQHLPPIESPPEPFTVPTTRRRHRARYIASALFIIVLVSLGSGLYSLLSQKSTVTRPDTPGQVEGYVSFRSSGLVGRGNATQGFVDELMIDLPNIPSPHVGKSYFAWLLGDNANSEALPLLLGKLTVDHGRIHYLYVGNQQHTNLIANTSRFLITEENALSTPLFPSSDAGTQLYYAEISQTPSPTDTQNHYSLLDHLRHLLSSDPKLNRLGLFGGLDFWFLKNTGQVSQWASEAKDSWQKKDINALRQQLVDILYYLDGKACIEPDVNGVPQGTPRVPENAIIANIAHAGILQPCTQQPIPGYLSHILAHLSGVIHSPGTRPDQLKLVSKIIREIDQINILLYKVHQDAQQLVKMTNAQLLQLSAQSILNDMATQAIDTYGGQTKPSTTSVQANVQQVHNDIQRLATLEIIHCPASTTSSVCT